MRRYRFVADYRSGAGVWAAGEVVEFADDFAAWLNRDVPGVVVPVTEPETRTLDAPSQDRMVKQARRRDRQGDPSDHGEITKADFKAVKDRA